MQKIALYNRNALPDAMYAAHMQAYNRPQVAKVPTNYFVAKTLVIMKLTIFLLLAGLLQVHAEGVAQKVTYTAKEVPILQVFKAIEKQTGYTVFANKELLKNVRPVTIQASSLSLQDFLDVVLKDQPIGYEILNKTIFIKAKAQVKVPETPQISNPVEVPEPPRQINGTVVDAEGAPLANATIQVKGTNQRTLSAEDGTFTIAAEAGQVLVVSYVGYNTLEVQVTSQTTYSIALEKLAQEMEQVVVTALGISRKAKSISYNVQEIGNEEVRRVDNGNFMNSLVGKVAGATINSSAAGNGASARVVLRGVKSISGNNNALYVIDGIPMPNNIRGQAEDIFSGAGQTGDFLANLNPEDIESISVLSGPSAAALYGGAAANGAIMVNTKKGAKSRTHFSVSNGTYFSSPMILPRFQNTYGQSETGSYQSWGEKLVAPSSYHPSAFFQTGVNNNTNLSFSTGNATNQTYVSLGHLTSAGIVNNNNFDRSNLTVRNTATFLDGKMEMDASFMGSLIDERNMITQGQYFNPLVAVYLFPPGDDFNRVRAFARHDASRNLMTQFWPYGDNGLMMQNPFWVTQNNLFDNHKQRYMTTLSLRYKLTDGITLSGRAKLDKSNEKSERKFAASTNTLFASENGYYALNTFDNRQVYAEGMVNITKKLSDDFSLTGNVGTALEDIRFNQYMYGGRLQGVANLYTFENVNRTTAEMSQSGFARQKQSLFGSAQVGYKGLLYLDVTGRNDWASTLANSGSQSFFYSSTGLSAIVSDMVNLRPANISYLKVRAAYSEVGNEPDVFLTNPTYPLAGGLPVTQTRLPNPSLKPELTKSWEAGINSAFFKGALKVDATVYYSRTFNQFFEPTLSSASGFTSVIVNAGRVDNKGIELSARYQQKVGAVEWGSYLTWSLNRNRIVELLPGWTNPVTGETVSLRELDMSGTGSYKMVLKEGGMMGDIYVNSLRVDEHGAIYVDPGSQQVVGNPNEFLFAGNSNPLYNIGWGNDFEWKGIRLNVLMAGRVGGVVVSNTQAIMDAFGVSQATADARDNGGAIVNGRPIPAKEYYQTVGAGASGGIGSMYVYSATNLRVAEAALGYEFPTRMLGRHIRSANVSLVGRNLFFLYNSAPFDPELTANTQTYFQGIDYFMMPSLRSFGFSLKLNL